MHAIYIFQAKKGINLKYTGNNKEDNNKTLQECDFGANRKV